MKICVYSGITKTRRAVEPARPNKKTKEKRYTMTYIKTLIALTGLVIMTACGGAAPPAASADRTPTDPCIANPFGATCDATASTILTAREIVCLDNSVASPLCAGENGIVDVFCKANPFDLRIGCRSENYASFRQTACLNTPTVDARCTETDGIIDTFCKANPFDSRIGCTDAAYDSLRQEACQINKNREECIPMVMRICVGDNVLSPFCDDTPNILVLRIPLCSMDDNVLSPSCDDTLNILDSRIAICITGDNANNPRCNGLFTDTATNDCIDNPFTPACGQEDSDFADYVDDARTNRLEFCGIGTNAFDPFCDDDNTPNILNLQITFCIMGDNSNNPRCDGIFGDAAIDGCFDNPFTVACGQYDSYFSAYADEARTNRLEFCDIGANAFEPFCDNVRTNRAVFCDIQANFNERFCINPPNIVGPRVTICIMGDNAKDSRCEGLFADMATNDCIDNPFTPACGQEGSGFADYADSARTNRARFCNIATNADDPFCMGENVALVCRFDPSTAICLDAPVAVRIGACGLRVNAESTACTESILSNPNAATWAQSFETPLRTTATAENQFLRGGATELDAGFGDTHLPLNLGGSLVDVMAYGSVPFIDAESMSKRYYYAGLLSEVDLGAPLTETAGVVNWQGAIGAIGIGMATTARIADIEINFELKTIDIFAQAGADNSTFHYLITGSYDDLGVITGRGTNPVTYANFGGTMSEVDDEFAKSLCLAQGGMEAACDAASQKRQIFTGNRTMIVDQQSYGRLTGLIGQAGVVGAFISNADADVGYSGGFVAKPTVATDVAFRNYYRLQTGAKQLYGSFTEGGAQAFMEELTSVNANDIATPLHGTFNPFSVVDAGDGFALLFGRTNAGDGNQVRYRAGLLSGTNLGAPLFGAPTDATWEGEVYVSRHVTDVRLGNLDRMAPLPVELTLTVDFSAGTIGTTTAVTTAVSETIEISGQFRAGSNNPTLPLGILGGTVTYNDGVTAHTDLPLIGLIGVEGAIGIFHGADAIDMVGGFAVKP